MLKEKIRKLFPITRWLLRRNLLTPKAYYNLGIALNNERKYEEAISHYKMAIRIHPDFANAHYNLGIILIQKGAMKEAVHHFREAARLRPEFVKARDYLKFALLQSRELE